MHYNFYFDESFHDRAITLKVDGTLNVLDSDKNDNYIGVFWGCPNTKLSRVIKLLSEFEDRQRKNFGLPIGKELKSTNIAKDHFKYGIKSFNKNTKEFYCDLFSTMIKIQPIIQIETISKLEYFIREVFRHTDLPDVVNSNSFYYSLTKFFLVYHNPEILEALYRVNNEETANDFKRLLLTQIDMLLQTIHGIERKIREENAYSEIYAILSNIDITIQNENKYYFDYSPNFHGLINLLNETGLSETKVNLTIDQEEKTFRTAQKFPFSSVKQQKSHNSVQLRLSDWISGFIGRMMYALVNDSGMTEDKVVDFNLISENDLTTKRILSEEWFEIKKEDLELYHLIYNALVVKQEHYWTTMTMSYCDQTVMFYSLLRYFASYKSYEEFSKIAPPMHSEYYNSCCCMELERYYKNI